ncbi:MAG TPA: PQQ-binding-like beta-propeller repeat protein [Pirellulales bacterium]|nr:PQQ-binding-like beta-propeller repeat protein [Pirellulales bacterium]
MIRASGVCLLAVVSCFTSPAAQATDEPQDWRQFRGPKGSASGDARLPAEWDGHVRWRSELPGPGGSSPIVVGRRIFLTCYSGYGVDAESPGDRHKLVRQVLCFNRDDGKLLWQHDVPAAEIVARYVDFLRQHGYTTSTPVSDGERVYVSLENSGVHAFDLAGEPLWQRGVGNHVHNWGSAGSLTLEEGRLFVNAAVECDSLLALDKLTGEEVWRFKRVVGSWSTPTPADLPDGGRQVLLNEKPGLLGLDRHTGRQLWFYPTDQSVGASTPTVVDGIVYLSGGNPKFVAAIRPAAVSSGGGDDAAQPAVIWRTDGVGSGIASPVVYGGRVYVVDRGVASCLDAGSGAVLSKARLSPSEATFYASPVIAGKRLFAVSRESGIYVLSTEPKFVQVANNRLDDSVFNATPAIHDGELLVRSNRFLYCIGKDSDP